MRRLLGLVAGGLLLAGTAQASTLPFGGVAVFQLATLPGLTLGGPGSTATVNASGALGSLNSLAFGPNVFGPVTQAVPVTSSTVIASVRFTGMANAAASFTPAGGGAGALGGPMGFSGLAKICLISTTCGGNVPVPLTPTTGGIGFGVGGVQIVGGSVKLTMQHNPWTVGLPTMTIHSVNSTVTTPTLPGGFAHGPGTAGLASAGQPGGVLQLVTVSKTYTSLTSNFPELPLIGLLNITFVPEPGTLLLLGSGIAGLAILGRKRARK